MTEQNVDNFQEYISTDTDLFSMIIADVLT